MGKQILMLVCISVGSLCFSMDISLEEDAKADACFEFLSNGTSYLLLNEPQTALEYFEKGHNVAALSHTDRDALDFCLYFAETVVFDIVGFEERSYQSMSALLQTFTLLDSADEEQDEQYDLEPDTRFFHTQELNNVIALLRHLSLMAPSLEVRRVLTSLVQEIAEETIGDFQFAEPVYLQNDEWVFDSNDCFTLELCKKHDKSKKHKKKSKLDKLSKWMDRLEKLVKLIKKGKDIYETVKGIFE